VFADLAVAIADGADAISGIAVLADREELWLFCRIRGWVRSG
jgi:hypothetical protein